MRRYSRSDIAVVGWKRVVMVKGWEEKMECKRRGRSTYYSRKSEGRKSEGERGQKGERARVTTPIRGKRVEKLREREVLGCSLVEAKREEGQKKRRKEAHPCPHSV